MGKDIASSENRNGENLLQHWIAGRASGFRRDIVAISQMYLTDTPAVIQSKL